MLCDVDALWMWYAQSGTMPVTLLSQPKIGDSILPSHLLVPCVACMQQAPMH
jgi:hypothetical protein